MPGKEKTCQRLCRQRLFPADVPIFPIFPIFPAESADFQISKKIPPHACESSPRSIWSFRKLAKRPPAQFGGFASVRNVPQLVLEVSQACDAITQDDTAVLQRWDQSRRAKSEPAEVASKRHFFRKATIYQLFSVILPAGHKNRKL